MWIAYLAMLAKSAKCGYAGDVSVLYKENGNIALFVAESDKYVYCCKMIF